MILFIDTHNNKFILTDQLHLYSARHVNRCFVITPVNEAPADEDTIRRVVAYFRLMIDQPAQPTTIEYHPPAVPRYLYGVSTRSIEPTSDDNDEYILHTLHPRYLAAVEKGSGEIEKITPIDPIPQQQHPTLILNAQTQLEKILPHH